MYLKENKPNIEKLGRGHMADTGTIDSLIEASLYIKSIERRQGLKIAFQKKLPGD